MLDESTFSADKEVRFVDLVQVGGSALVLEGLNDVLTAGLKVHYGEQNLTFVVI